MPIPVTTTRVRFASEGDTLVGDLHRPVHVPDGLDGVAVLVTGSWTTVKEQQADFYARRLAARGFAALTFDFRGFGQSGGTPRDWENPERKIADVNAAIGFLGLVPDVDEARIGALGICASSGYQAVNAAADGRVRSLAMIAPWLHDGELVAPYYGGTEGVAERIGASRRAYERYRDTGRVEFIPAASATDPSAAMFGPYDYYLDPGRGAVPEWDARIAVMSWEPWLTFDPIPAASDIAAPVLMVHSRDGAVPEGARRFYEKLAGPKSLVWSDGSQLDFYDQPRQVEVALDATVEHFRATL